MFCSNCGKEIFEDTKFCNHCGVQNVSQPVAAPTNTSEAAAQKAKKAPKKVNLIVALAVVLIAFLMGKFVIAPALVSEPNTDEERGQTQQTDSTINTSNAAYDAVFDNTYIVHFQSFFNMDMANYALKQADGSIYCADYGYQDDVVKQWVETMYIPVAEYTDSQKSELENTMKSQFAAVDALSCCTVNYKMGANYFTITCTYADVDQAENYSELYNAKILQTNTFISMSATENGLLTQGFIKK